MLKAAEKIIAAEGNRDELDFAVDVKMRSLETPGEIKAFAEELKKSDHEKQAARCKAICCRSACAKPS